MGFQEVYKKNQFGWVLCLFLFLVFFSTSIFSLHYTIPIPNKFCCKNGGTDHILQAFHYQKKNSPKLFKRKILIPFNNNNILFLKMHYTAVSMLFTKFKNMQ